MAHCSPFNRSIRSISLYRVSIFVLCFAVLASLSTRRAAALDLTPATANAGWKLTAFASGFPVKDKTTIGPLGIAFTNEGKVLVADYHGGDFGSGCDNTGRYSGTGRYCRNLYFKRYGYGSYSDIHHH